MNWKLLSLSMGATLTFALPQCRAEKASDLQPVLAKSGKQIAQETFTDAKLAKVWAANKGDWQVKDGVLVGKEKASDNHPAVLLLGTPNHNSIIRFSFKLDGAEGFNLSYNHAKGHLFRIVINPDGLTMNKDKDKKDEKSKAEQLGKASGKFEPGKWYTMMVEIQGGKVSVQTDNGVKMTANNATLDVDKVGYRFVTRKASLLLDDITAWEVAP